MSGAFPVLYEELPASIYTDPDRFEREFDAVFTRNWLLAGPLDSLPDPGAVAVSLARRDVLVTRSGETVRAFHNVCSHRGSSIVGERCEGERLRCPYHGWVYALDGSVAAVPGRSRFGSGLDVDACGLPPVAAHVWGGLVWVSLSAAAPSFDTWLGEWAGELARYRTDLQRVFAGRIDVVPLNWKAAVDAFNETYHVSFIHPGSVGRLVNPRAAEFRYGGAHSRGVTPVRQTLAEAQGRRSPGAVAATPSSPLGKDLLPEQAAHHCNYTLFPNTFFNFLSTWAIILQFDPLDVGSTEIRTWMLVDHSASERHEHALELQWTEFSKVLDEDLRSLVAVGRGMRSPAFERVRLGGEEERLVHFHRTVGTALGEEQP